MSNRSPEMDAWLDEARNTAVFTAFQKLRNQPKLHKSGEGMTGPCPICNDGTDRFTLNFHKNAWFCRKSCGGGNSLDLLIKAEGVTLLEAAEALTGISAPNGAGSNSKPVDEDALRERREERSVAKADEENEEQLRRREKRVRVQNIFNDCQPFKGSLAERYLANRKIVLMPDQTTDLRFLPEAKYMGYADREAEHETDLGKFPAMVAAVRNVQGEIIGIHRTYLDPEKFAKLKPPGDTFRNKAKKVWPEQKGGHIQLGPFQEVMAIGEGIETTASWYQLGIGPDQVGILCAVNLGNLSGKAKGTLKHPKKPKSTIQNGEPVDEQDNEGIRLPAIVRHVILLVDGDSDPYSTKAHILTAGRRFRNLGLEVDICHPGIEGDFNDLLMRQN